MKDRYSQLTFFKNCPTFVTYSRAFRDRFSVVQVPRPEGEAEWINIIYSYTHFFLRQADAVSQLQAE